MKRRSAKSQSKSRAQHGPTTHDGGADPVPATGAVRRKLLFSAIVVGGLLGMTELVLALCGVTPLLSREDPFVGFSSRVPLFVEDTSSNDGGMMVTARNKIQFFNFQRFPAAKPPGTYRIFCMGGSTTYGRPYNDKTSFCGWLRAMLPVADPSRTWEVINAGGISYASHRVAKLMGELVQYEPDLFVVYSGHNEFLEERTYGSIRDASWAVQGVSRVLGHTRLYTVASHVLGTSTALPTRRDDFADEVETLLDNTVGPDAYTRNDALRERILAEYRENLSAMVNIARRAGAKILLVATASNLRDCSPFKSEHRADLTESHRGYWRVLAERAFNAVSAGRPEQALGLIDQALGVDDRHAHLHYQRGRVLWDLGRYEAARESFVRARDEDVCPLRALSPMREIARDVAQKHDAPMVDFVATVDQLSERGTPGKDLFLDHVHPTIEGNRHLALAILEAMIDRKLVRPAPVWGDSEIQRITEQVEGTLDHHAHGVALRNLAKVLSWAGKHEEAYDVAVQATQQVQGDAEAHYLVALGAELLGRPEEAIREYRLAVEANPLHIDSLINLGAALQTKGIRDQAKAYYRQAVEVVPTHAKANYNLGLVLRAEGKANEAVPHLRVVIQQMPDFAPAHFYLGSALLESGNHDQALPHFQRSAQLKPDWPAPLQGMARVFATHPDPSVRDEAQAARLNERAATLSSTGRTP